MQGDKIRTIVAYNDDKIKKGIIEILKKNKDIEIVAVAKDVEDTYKQITELKPEMVFTEYQGLEIIKKSKEALKDKVPVFNIIAQDIPKGEFIEAKKIIGDKMNTVIREQTEVRYNGIIEDYKDYMNYNVDI